MSEQQSLQKRDEEIRELEREKTRLELEFRKKQSAAQAQQSEWEKKKREVDTDREKVEERLRGFLTHCEHQEAIGRAPDTAVVDKHRRKLEDSIAELKTKRADIDAQQGSDMRSYLEGLDAANKQLQKAHEAVLGAKELLEAEKAFVAETPKVAVEASQE